MRSSTSMSSYNMHTQLLPVLWGAVHRWAATTWTHTSWPSYEEQYIDRDPWTISRGQEYTPCCLLRRLGLIHRLRINQLHSDTRVYRRKISQLLEKLPNKSRNLIIQRTIRLHLFMHADTTMGTLYQGINPMRARCHDHEHWVVNT